MRKFFVVLSVLAISATFTSASDSGLTAEEVSAVSYAARPTSGKSVRRYTNSDIPHKNRYSLSFTKKLKPSGKVYTNADLDRKK